MVLDIHQTTKKKSIKKLALYFFTNTPHTVHTELPTRCSQLLLIIWLYVPYILSEMSLGVGGSVKYELGCCQENPYNKLLYI